MRDVPPNSPGGRLRLRVNPIRCTAFGFCAEYAPELFGLDEWGYAWLHGAEVPPGLEGLAEEAARRCPTRAILVERVSPGASSPIEGARRPGGSDRAARGVSSR